MPMFMNDQDESNKLVFFCELPLNVEEFVVGFLYTLVAFCDSYLLLLGMVFMLTGLRFGIDYLRKGECSSSFFTLRLTL